MAAISNYDFGLKLCKILGLDPTTTKDIIITCMVEEPVMVYVSHYFQEDTVEALLTELKKVSPTFAERERITKKKSKPPTIPNDDWNWHGEQSPIG